MVPSQEIRGLLIPAAWDDQGRVTALGLAAFDESEYLLETGRLFTRLQRHLQQEVTLSGQLLPVEGGKLVFQVHSFTFRGLGEHSGRWSTVGLVFTLILMVAAPAEALAPGPQEIMASASALVLAAQAESRLPLVGD